MKIKDFEKLFNDVKEEYKIDSDLNIWVGDNPLKRPLLYGNNQLNFYVNSKRIFYIHNYMNNKEALYDEKNRTTL